MSTIPAPPASTKKTKGVGGSINNDNNIASTYNNRTGFLKLPDEQSSHRRLLTNDNHLKTNGRRRNRRSSSPSPDINVDDEEDEDIEEEEDEIGPMDSKIGKLKTNGSRVMFSNNNNNLRPSLLEQGESGIANGSSSDMMDISDDDGREGWDNKMQFFMGVISYAVGFGKI
uniref:Ion_trans_2 domain-containing protein n=1 Tax=Meloidogyne hapla TaxID=6305 RepID=A0A1I8BSK4_MELHA